MSGDCTDSMADCIAENTLDRVIAEHTVEFDDSDRYLTSALASLAIIELKNIFGRKFRFAVDGYECRVHFCVKCNGRLITRSIVCVPDDLLPCPFCGGKAETAYGLGDRRFIMCAECGCRTSNKTYVKASLDWNRRVGKKVKLLKKLV